MKVLVSLPALNTGGLEILNLAIANSSDLACTHGLDLYFAVPQDGSLFNSFKASNCKLFILKSFSILPYIFSIRSLVKKNGIEIVHVHHPLFGMLAPIALLGTNVKVVMSIHGYSKKRSFNQWLHNFILNLSCLACHKIICVSHSFAETIKKETWAPKHKIRVVYNTINEKSFSDEKAEEVHNKKKKGKITMGMVGNFVPEKDQYTLILAFALFKAKIPNSHLFFVGSHGQNSQCMDKCVKLVHELKLTNHVTFLGSRKDVSQILNSLDLFIMSSIEDSFGIALVEAMLHKVPVIVTEIPVLKEVTDNGNLAKTFHPKNHQNLANRLLEVHENNKETAKRVELAFDFAKEKFSINAHLASLSNVYHNN